jgi:hypothetical protein
MMSNGPQHNNGNDNLVDLIAYFARTVPHMPEVKLEKLIYIAQLYHYSNYGELLTKTRFFSLSYGPHAPLIRSTLKKQLENKSIYLAESRTSEDPVYSNPCMIIKSSEQKDNNLCDLYLNTLRKVVEDWGDKHYEHILDYTARTIPYLSTFFKAPISWTLIRPYPNLKHTLSLPQRVQIHKFVEDPAEAMPHHYTCSEGCPISINEITEIYLVLCGELPDKIPSQECLGFNLPTVLSAFDKLRDQCESSIEEFPPEIDKAAQLTHSLLNAMSFRGYSSRVALKTGMLYLKKLGYSFDRDVLEDNWPDGHSCEIFKKWFSSVSVGLGEKGKE